VTSNVGSRSGADWLLSFVQQSLQRHRRDTLTAQSAGRQRTESADRISEQTRQVPLPTPAVHPFHDTLSCSYVQSLILKTSVVSNSIPEGRSMSILSPRSRRSRERSRSRLSRERERERRRGEREREWERRLVWHVSVVLVALLSSMGGGIEGGEGLMLRKAYTERPTRTRTRKQKARGREC
jgi:hypothetical protein